MRVKSVPRHVVRKNGVIAKEASAVKTANPVLAEILQNNNNYLHVKTINFTNYYDILQETERLDLREKTEPQEVKLEALDLSRKMSEETPSKQLKDTYLYQIMTDPELLTKISQQPRAQPQPQPQPQPRQTAATSCPHCKESFPGEEEVKRHLNQLSCCVCGKSFGQRRYLRYHQRCHSERNKFSCAQCPRKYSRLDNLTRHNVFHTNPDKFPCGSCDRAFARKDLLNKHLKCHENRYKFPCHVCRKYFKGQISLENHNKLYHL